DVFSDPTGQIGKAALALGLAHRQLHFTEANLTPLGAVIAAPLPELRELFCRNGLKYYARIQTQNIRNALRILKKQRGVLETILRQNSASKAGRMLVRELEFAVRMAEQSCYFMLWQHLLARGKTAQAKSAAAKAIRDLKKLEKEFAAFWPRRNKS